MYTLLRSLTLRQMLLGQAPVALAALLVAEVAYKFHSFTLECGAFLVTWFVFDYVADTLRRRLLRRSPAQR